jgi:hypothetical protein
MLAFVDRNALSYAVSSMSRSLVIAVALLAACADKQLEQLQDIKDEVCACKTPECGEAAMKKVPQGEKMKSDAKKQRLARDMMDCMAKLLEQGRPTTDPDAEAPPP